MLSSQIVGCSGGLFLRSIVAVDAAVVFAKNAVSGTDGLQRGRINVVPLDEKAVGGESAGRLQTLERPLHVAPYAREEDIEALLFGVTEEVLELLQADGVRITQTLYPQHHMADRLLPSAFDHALQALSPPCVGNQRRISVEQSSVQIEKDSRDSHVN